VDKFAKANAPVENENGLEKGYLQTKILKIRDTSANGSNDEKGLCDVACANTKRNSRSVKLDGLVEPESDVRLRPNRLIVGIFLFV
jgi:hypothetical protein